MVFSVLARQRIAFAFLCLIWGSTWLAMKVGVQTVPPAMFSALRWTAAGGMLLAFVVARGEQLVLPPRLIKRVVLCSLLLICATAALSMYGVRHIASGLAAVLTSALTPLALLGFSVLTKQERFHPRALIALGLGLAGIFILFGPRAFKGELHVTEMVGAGLVIIGNLCYALGSVLSRPAMRTIPPVQLAAFTNLIGGLCLFVLSLGGEPGAVAALRLDWGLHAWLAVLFLLVPAALAASTIYFFLVRDWGASRTGTYAFISPVIAVLLGAGLNDEALGLTEALGIAMMLAASWMVLRRA